MSKIFFGATAVALGLITGVSALRAFDGGDYLLYVVMSGNYPTGRQSVWIWLALGEVLLSLVGIVGMWIAHLHKRYWPMAFFVLLQLPLPLVTEATRCDVDNWFCRSFSWAAVDKLLW